VCKCVVIAIITNTTVMGTMIKLANVSQLSKEWNIWVGNEM